ncbi:hypothetical protein ACJMK2_002118 [Sinanodonta woodiana]|uniref:CCR4-Not complex component Not1 C-terminal domain-containing protein n=1 Tax=Sinanodonta woodiana TaxID=1069815 RepID=A0ABD3XUE6_SINWO
MTAESQDPEKRKIYAQRLIKHLRFAATADRDDCRRLSEGEFEFLLTGTFHHFPEVLCEHHYDFIDAMPPQWIEMRNIVSCAFQRNMQVPNPLTPGLNVAILPEMKLRPQFSPSYVKQVESMPFKKDLDSNLEIGTPVSIYHTVLSSILLNARSFDVPLINTIVFYVGTHAIDDFNSKDLNLSVNMIAQSSRQLILTAMCNQLTCPNSHTLYFSCLLQYLFSSVFGCKAHKEIASVILERLAFRPHPWGVLITTMELMKDPVFAFFTREFISSSPEIEIVTLPYGFSTFFLYTDLFLFFYKFVVLK